MNSYPFPPEIVSPKTKIKPEYGLAHVKAQYYTDNRYGFRGQFGTNDFQTMIEFAQGRASVQGMQQLFGMRVQPRPGDNTPESLAAINVQNMNLAPKYINRAVAKMQRQNYDISLEAVDLNSINEKLDFAALVQNFYRLKDWVQKMGIPLQTAFPGLDVATLPKYPDEMLFNITTNPKIKKEIKGELALKLVLYVSNFNQKQREVDWDLVVHGRGHMHYYLDENNYPRVDRVNPEYWYGSYVPNDDFEIQEYAGFLDCITVNQFIREASSQFDQKTLEKIVQGWGTKNSALNSVIYDRTFTQYDNLTYIPVVRFYFLSEDNKAFVTRKNQYDGWSIFDRPYDFVPDVKSKARYEQEGDSQIHRSRYTSIYGGTWIIDSDIVFNYGRKAYPRTNLVNQSLPIKTAATNFKNGRFVSFASQIIEPIFQVNVIHNKIKTILAKERIGMRNINFDALENINMGRGGAAWTPQEVYRYGEMTGDWITRGQMSPYGQTQGQPVMHESTGVELSDYFTAMTFYLNMLDQMTGSTVTEMTNVPDRLPAKAVQVSEANADIDLEYLLNARKYLYERGAHQMLLLTQESMRHGTVIKGFNPAIGHYHETEKMDPVAYSDFGILLGKQAGPQEWIDFYQDIREMIIAGRLGASDSAYLREIDNMKQARQMLAIREKQYLRQVAEEKMRDNQMMMESNVKAAEAKMIAELRVQQQEMEMKKELLILEGQIKGKLQAEKSESDKMIKQVSDHVKRMTEQDKTRGEIIKTGVRNQADFRKADSNERSTIVNARVNLEKAEKQLEAQRQKQAKQSKQKA